jgi:hypothetical protein
MSRPLPAVLAVPWLAACLAPPPAPPPPPAREPAIAERQFGLSVEGRPLRLRVAGDGPRRVLWIGGIHGDEREGSVATAELPHAFLARPKLAERVRLWVVEDVNPDGSARGTRRNARGVDLNRNYPARNFRPSPDNGPSPLSEPEALALHALVQQIRPELVIVAHSARGRHFINWDGPAERHAARFSSLTRYPIVASEALHGTPGSLGSWLGRDLQVPILTLEHRNGADPRQCWERTREAILAVIAEV